MPGKLLYSVITPHSPRMAVEATAPPFLKGVIEGSHELGRALRAAKPDLLIVHSTHWVCSFNWYVTAHERHRGLPGRARPAARGGTLAQIFKRSEGEV